MRRGCPHRIFAVPDVTYYGDDDQSGIQPVVKKVAAAGSPGAGPT